MGRRPVEVLSRGEVERLLGACSGSPIGLRNRALIVAMWRGGLRVSEALGLLPKDFDQAEGTLRVLRGKGDKARTVGIDPQASAVIGQWLEARKAFGLNGHQPIFCTVRVADRGRAMKRTDVPRMLKRLARKAGIEKRVHPHGLRHAHASELMAEGASLAVISQQLGHTSFVTTERYLHQIRPEKVLEFTKRRTWGEVEGVWLD